MGRPLHEVVDVRVSKDQLHRLLTLLLAPMNTPGPLLVTHKTNQHSKQFSYEIFAYWESWGQKDRLLRS